MDAMREQIKRIEELMERADYVTDRAIATSVHLAMSLRKPLLIEGHAGVGKTEVAKVMARVLNTSLIRLQCYEGLDANQTLYEWNYPKQILHIKLEESTAHSLEHKEAAIFSEPFLIRRPLLQALTPNGAAPVLLIDEVDRGDEELEAFLLEVLSEYQVTIPELGTIKAKEPPYVILTSNRIRELSDALRRRCLYLWIDFPGYDKEVRIVTRKVPGINERLAGARCGWPRYRAWRRRWTGHRRSCRSTPITWTAPWSPRRSAASSRTPTTSSACAVSSRPTA
jgi:MoxR-like ATPase